MLAARIHKLKRVSALGGNLSSISRMLPKSLQVPQNCTTSEFRLKSGTSSQISRLFCSQQEVFVDNDPEAEKKARRDRMIKMMLEADKEIVDEGEYMDSTNKILYKGSLIVCPTPIGNLNDISIRLANVIETADIIACEDTRVTSKLINTIKAKYPLLFKFVKRQAEAEQNENIASEFEDETIFGEKKRPNEDHPNMFQIRREKKRMKELYQKQEMEKMITESKNILKDLDTFRFHQKEEEDDFGPFDSSSRKPKDKSMYGLDNPYIDYLNEKIQECKLKKGRGLFMSLHKYNEEGRVDKLIQAMQAGFTVALMSDAGTPTVSDPGSLLVDACLKNNVRVESLPGPNVVSIALAGSGYPSDRYNFVGYLSKTPSERNEELEIMKESGRTFVLFENKHRLLNLLRAIEKLFGPRQSIFLGMELTKMHERTIRGDVADVYEIINQRKETNSGQEEEGSEEPKRFDKMDHRLKGEITIVVPPYNSLFNPALRADSSSDPLTSESESQQAEIEKVPRQTGEDIDRVVGVLQERLEVDNRQLLELASEILGLSVNKIRNHLRESRKKKHILYTR